MKRHEKDLILGTFVTAVGYLMLIWIHFVTFVCWTVIILGKLIIFISIRNYILYKKAIRGEGTLPLSE